MQPLAAVQAVLQASELPFRPATEVQGVRASRAHLWRREPDTVRSIDGVYPMKKVLLVLCLVPFIAAAPPVTKVSLSQIQVTAAASQPGAILMVMTTGILQQVQLGTGFVLTTGSDGQPVLSAP